MSVFGGGCLNVWSEVLPSAESPRSPSPPSRQGHLRCSKVHWPDLDRCGLGGGFPRSPLEARAVGPDAMEDNGDFAGNGHLGLLGTDPLHLPDAPSFQSRPALGSMKQHTCRLEQLAPQQSSRPTWISVSAVKRQANLAVTADARAVGDYPNQRNSTR